ncbi:MAG: cytochrome c biogenesis protein CcdA [Gammaproteobacteria bacterium]|nr:cytochrome c biogenesis protein CcdA [Gammaproteobacteria bacterium]
MEILFGYLAGILTLINPCVLPVLPIALASALQNDRKGPMWLALGMSVTFVILGVGVSAIGSSFGIDEEDISRASAVLMMLFGLILLVPVLNNRFSLATAGLSSNADMTIGKMDQKSVKNQLLGGALLGAVWSPCIGPTLGGAISLASQGNNLIWATLIMSSFAAGISTIIIVLAYGAREAISKRQANMRVIAEKARPVMGITFLFAGFIISLKWHQVIEGWLLDRMPFWLQDLSVLF